MKKNLFVHSAFFIFATIFLTVSFYRDGWGVVDPTFYKAWQSNFDQTVVARMAKTRQDGFLSAGGLLGLGDVPKWSFINGKIVHQYNVYLNEGKFRQYIGYTSTPGFQGIVFGIPDQILRTSKNTNLKIFRGSVALVSAITLALISTWLTVEFSWLAGILVVLFAGLSEALIRAGGSIYWNLWVFYIPLMITTLFLAQGSKKKTFPLTKLLWALYLTCLLKVLMNGFEGITTVMVMVTVPFVYYAILDKWDWKTFLQRVFIVGLVLVAAVITGLIILSIQIALYKGNFSASSFYIWDALNRRAIGDPDNYSGIMADSMRASIFTVIWKYLRLDSFTIHLQQQTWHILFLQVFIIFAVCTLIFILKYRRANASYALRKGQSLAIATWYSFLAPLSWFILFKPDAYFHTSIYTMLWHMPFTLLGTALCGFVITDLLKRKRTNE